MGALHVWWVPVALSIWIVHVVLVHWIVAMGVLVGSVSRSALISWCNWDIAGWVVALKLRLAHAWVVV